LAPPLRLSDTPGLVDQAELADADAIAAGVNVRSRLESLAAIDTQAASAYFAPLESCTTLRDVSDCRIADPGNNDLERTTNARTSAAPPGLLSAAV
jgi:hypothetical protein